MMRGRVLQLSDNTQDFWRYSDQKENRLEPTAAGVHRDTAHILARARMLGMRRTEDRGVGSRRDDIYRPASQPIGYNWLRRVDVWSIRGRRGHGAIGDHVHQME